MTDNATLVFHNTPFLIVGGIVAAFLLLMIVCRIRDWLQERRERKADKAREEESEGVRFQGPDVISFPVRAEES